jgi:hypothetical protein
MRLSFAHVTKCTTEHAPSGLGDATVSITPDTYSHAIPAVQEEAVALIAGLVFAK